MGGTGFIPERLMMIMITGTQLLNLISIIEAKAEITASVPAGVHWRASPEGMPLWGPNRFWPVSGLALRCLGPGFTVPALGPGFRPILILILILNINIIN